MPELPEVETVRRQLEPVLLGADDHGAVRSSTRAGARRWRRTELADAVDGRRVQAVRRRGKYLDLGARRRDPPAHAPADDGHAAARAAGEHPPHTRVEITLRRAPPAALRRPAPLRHRPAARRRRRARGFFAARLGVEPFDEAFTPRCCARSPAGGAAPIKSFLLDQRQIAGIGNIYADEALFRAGVHPLRAAGALRPRPVRAAARRDPRGRSPPGSTRSGASIDDFRDLDGARGSFQDRFLVHRRAGRALPGVRHDDPQARRRRARYLRLRALPAGAAARPARRGERTRSV